MFTTGWRPVWARGRCRISPPRFLAECYKRQLNQGSLVLLYFRLFTFSDLYWVCLSVFSCTVLFISISQVIGCEDRLRNDLYCVEWGVKLYSNQPSNMLQYSQCHTKYKQECVADVTLKKWSHFHSQTWQLQKLYKMWRNCAVSADCQLWRQKETQNLSEVPLILLYNANINKSA